MATQKPLYPKVLWMKPAVPSSRVVTSLFSSTAAARPVVGQPEEHVGVCCQPGARPCSGNLGEGRPRGQEPRGSPHPSSGSGVGLTWLSRRHSQSQPPALLSGQPQRTACEDLALATNPALAAKSVVG